MTEPHDHVQNLITKAATEFDSMDAMRFAQAALNAAQALVSLQTAANIMPPHRLAEPPPNGAVKEFF
jgi:hypothetical protein